MSAFLDELKRKTKAPEQFAAETEAAKRERELKFIEKQASMIFNDIKKDLLANVQKGAYTSINAGQREVCTNRLISDATLYSFHRRAFERGHFYTEWNDGGRSEDPLSPPAFICFVSSTKHGAGVFKSSLQTKATLKMSIYDITYKVFDSVCKLAAEEGIKCKIRSEIHLSRTISKPIIPHSNNDITVVTNWKDTRGSFYVIISATAIY